MKYFEIMELECNTPINNKSVGADFYYIPEAEVYNTIEQIKKRKNNYNTKEISKHDFDYEIKRNKRKSLYLMTGK